MTSRLANHAIQQVSCEYATQFPSAPHHGGGDIYNISGQANVHLGNSYTGGQDLQATLVKQLIDRLSYPQMNARAHQVTQAFPATFDWMLKERDSTGHNGDCFISWLDDESGSNNIYWINGKPGSGKSTMTKFLDSRFKLGRLVFSRDMPVVRAQHFFWSGGQYIEKCIEGLCRSLLVQLIQQRPALADIVRDSLAQLDLSPFRVPWNKSLLSECLLELFQRLGQDSKVLLLIDGMDECMVQEEEQSELVELVFRMSEIPSVKVIITSRPENIFHDAFQDCPQVQMEKLTTADIVHYVHSKLKGQRRWKQLEQEDFYGAQSILHQVVNRADGVFLWVVLVVRDLLHDIREGDSLGQLEKKIDNLPADLGAYFQRIMESIEPAHREEASKLLQLAAFQEDSYASTLPFRLVDAFFTGESSIQFAHSGNTDFSGFDMKNQQRFRARVLNTLRRIRSRCKGLLECVWDVNSIFSAASGSVNGTLHAHTSDWKSYAVWLNDVFNVRVTFLHRSFYDFVSLADTQALIESLTGGLPFDNRGFLINSRALQIASLINLELRHVWAESNLIKEAICSASHVMTAMSRYGGAQESYAVLLFLDEPISRLASISRHNAWFIGSCFNTWYGEKSNYLSLAIDFGLCDYVIKNLSDDAISTKAGRPLLDYILRPRFHSEYAPAYTFPSIKLVDLALKNGADPNQPLVLYGPTVWAAFLWHIHRRDWLDRSSITPDHDHEREMLLQIVHKLLIGGASPYIENQWLDQLRAAEASSISGRSLGMNSGFESLQVDGGDNTASLVPVSELLKDVASGDQKIELFALLQSLEKPWFMANASEATPIVRAYIEPQS